VALTVTGVEAVTAVVCTVTMAASRPDCTVTLAGTGNAEALLESNTEAPPVGAGLVSVIVRLAEAPPAMLPGSIVTLLSAGAGTGVTVTLAVFVVELDVAVTVTGVEAVTEVVCTVILAVNRPGGTVMLAGTGNAGELLDSPTLTPAAAVGDAALSVTVRIALAPPAIVAGVTVNDVKAGRTTGTTLAFAVLVTLL
jgi:hypothetical protein